MTSELKPIAFLEAYDDERFFHDEISDEKLFKSLMLSLENGKLDKAITPLYPPSTRAVPDVPELVRYEFSEGVGEYIERVDGDYVRHDQAVAVIAGNPYYLIAHDLRIRAEAAESKLTEWEKADRLVAKALWEDKVKVLKAELAQINELLDEGQGDDEGSQILPDFEEDMSTLAKVEACLALLETRRDVIDGFEAKLAQIEKQEAVGYVVYYAIKVGIGRVTIRQSKIMDRVSATSCHSEWLKEASKHPDHFIETVKVYTAPVASDIDLKVEEHSNLCPYCGSSAIRCGCD